MKLGIMQPYIFPYIGYFQLINAVDKFVIYDDIEYTKKGWINRNRILLNGADSLFSLPLRKDSDFCHVNHRFLADSYADFVKKFKGQLVSAYSKAPFYKDVYPLIEKCLDYENHNLFDFVYNSLINVTRYLNIETPFVVSSTLHLDEQLKGEAKVIYINKQLNSSVYINAIGGQSLYSKDTFSNSGLDLKFIQSNTIVYPQFKNEFVSNLSIIDVMMFNSPDQIKGYLNAFTLI
jgi:hypothetical protein